MPPLFMTSLKTVKEKELEKATLRMLLHKKMAGKEAAREYTTVHASDLTKPEFCTREFALYQLTDKKPPSQFIGTSLRATYDLGRALQDLLNKLWGVEWCVGTWKCYHCGGVYKFKHKPDKCAECGHKYFEYLEEMFEHPVFGFTGSVDYLFHKGNGDKYKITEVKTIEKDGFKELVAPVAEHRVRTQLYLQLIYDCKGDYRREKIDLETATVLYICKGFGCSAPDLKDAGISDSGFSPFKEFDVFRTDGGGSISSNLTSYYEKAAQLQIFKNNTGYIPPGFCTTSFCKRAKYCSMRNQCWGGEYGSVKGHEIYHCN